MIVKILYGQKEGCRALTEPEHSVDQVVSKIIDCDTILVREDKTHWGFMAYAKEELIADHTFEVGETVAYIMEGGQTVDKLPRR